MFSNWCQDLSSVNNMISRDDILNEVSIILKTLHSIVNKLSVSTSNQSLNVSQENLPEFHHEEFWLDDDLVNVSMSVSQDVNNNNNSSSNNNSCNISEFSSVIDDDILQHIELFPSDVSSDEEQELSIADRVKLRKLSQFPMSTASVPEPQEKQLAMSGDPFILKMSSFINLISPKCIFNVKKSKRRRKKRATKSVHPELISLWNNVDDLFAPKVHVPRDSASNIPVVDWHKVNSRFIANVPAPSPQPLHGCSEDPEFYEHKTGRRC